MLTLHSPENSTSATGRAQGNNATAISIAFAPPGSAATRTCLARPLMVTRCGWFFRAT